ncbi:Peptidase, M48 (Ste24 endopeptidase) family protein [Flavobacterium sp. 9AF]|uniref:M48 family metallopeptidase n=1 Tax=Flavobacterium sp. 9AF TaxID=2653142 RepID=UPI0012F1B18A|nr:M48 family metallopeptidase [Flavobacterium sp. 9AF]VXB35754.1 Peptidase, M48 (Ste24 endopeptidase) family protein [Flavobacterium sp. 9AF]
MKVIIKGFVIVVSFFATWLLLSQLDLVNFFGVKSIKSNTENTVGELLWQEIEESEKIIYDEIIVQKLDSLLLPLCKKNNIVRDSLKVHLIHKDEVNAFAMPDNHLVVYSGLILDCKNEEALLGVLGHEIAHLQENHVMKKLSKEIGFSVLLSMTGANSQTIKKVIHTLSSSAYDRNLEREADLQSVKYMTKAEIDPRPFADFMYQMALDNEIHKYTYWISTHPESEDRAKYILNSLKGKKIKSKKIISINQWNEFKQLINDYK